MLISSEKLSVHAKQACNDDGGGEVLVLIRTLSFYFISYVCFRDNNIQGILILQTYFIIIYYSLTFCLKFQSYVNESIDQQ